MIAVFAEAFANALVLLATFGGGMYLICEVASEAEERKALYGAAGCLALCAGYAWVIAMAWEYL